MLFSKTANIEFGEAKIKSEYSSRAVYGKALTSGHNAAYSNLGTGNWVIYDPELGYRLNPARPTINSRSIRGPDITVPKPSGVFRVVVLGDSITAAQPGFVDELSDQLKRRGVIEVINASTPGYTSYQELMFFKRYLVDTDPDLVIWAYCLNDNHKFLHRFDEQAHMLWTDEARESLGLGINTWWDWVVSRGYVLTAIRIGLIRPPNSSSMFPWEAREDFNTAWKDYSWLFYEEHLREMIELLKPRRARLAIIIFPYEPQLTLRTYRQSRDYILETTDKACARCARSTRSRASTSIRDSSRRMTPASSSIATASILTPQDTISRWPSSCSFSICIGSRLAPSRGIGLKANAENKLAISQQRLRR